jgi:hypothetical protein
MSFRFRNAGATYQRAIQLCHVDQLYHNVEAYDDDMVIKTRTHNEFISIRLGHTGLCIWPISYRIRDGIWPISYTGCNYL